MSGKATIPNEDAFHKQRGRLVDSFALVETRLVQAIVRAGGKLKGDTFAGKIKSLRELKNGAARGDVEAALNRLVELNSLRTEIVHGLMSLYDASGERYAVFCNAREAANSVQPTTRITHRALRDAADELTKIAETISRS